MGKKVVECTDMTRKEGAFIGAAASGLINIATGVADHGYRTTVSMGSNPSAIFGTHSGAINGWTPDSHGNLLPATREVLPNFTPEQFAVAGLEVATALAAATLTIYGLTRRGNRTPYLRLVK